MPRKKKECVNADSNPECPYLTIISNNREDIKEIKKALIGDDMQSGLVSKIAHLELTNKVLIFIGGATLVALIGTILKLIVSI